MKINVDIAYDYLRKFKQKIINLIDTKLDIEFGTHDGEKYLTIDVEKFDYELEMITEDIINEFDEEIRFIKFFGDTK